MGTNTTTCVTIVFKFETRNLRLCLATAMGAFNTGYHNIILSKKINAFIRYLVPIKNDNIIVPLSTCTTLATNNKHAMMRSCGSICDRMNEGPLNSLCEISWYTQCATTPITLQCTLSCKATTKSETSPKRDTKNLRPTFSCKLLISFFSEVISSFSCLSCDTSSVMLHSSSITGPPGSALRGHLLSGWPANEHWQHTGAPEGVLRPPAVRGRSRKRAQARGEFGVPVKFLTAYFDVWLITNATCTHNLVVGRHARLNHHHLLFASAAPWHPGWFRESSAVATVTSRSQETRYTNRN